MKKMRRKKKRWADDTKIIGYLSQCRESIVNCIMRTTSARLTCRYQIELKTQLKRQLNIQIQIEIQPKLKRRNEKRERDTRWVGW